MITIRTAQMEAFREARIEAFEEKMAAALRLRFPSDFEGVDDRALLAEVQTGTAKALDFGLTTEPDIARYLFLRQMLGAEFETSGKWPWVAETMDDEELSPGARLSVLSVYAEHELGDQYVDLRK